jgi:hypothetical protein
MARTANGSKVVIIAVTATLTALGIGTIYLPFYVDRDKLRGMHEDADGNLSGKERREYEMLLSQLHEQQLKGKNSSSPQNISNDSVYVDEQVRKDNSMWARMKPSSTDKK